LYDLSLSGRCFKEVSENGLLRKKLKDKNNRDISKILIFSIECFVKTQFLGE